MGQVCTSQVDTVEFYSHKNAVAEIRLTHLAERNVSLSYLGSREARRIQITVDEVDVTQTAAAEIGPT